MNEWKLTGKEMIRNSILLLQNYTQEIEMKTYAYL